MSSSIVLTDDECIRWKNNPNCNPRTNYNIQTNSDTYNFFLERCGNPNIAPLSPSDYRPGLCRTISSSENCIRWRNNPNCDPVENNYIYTNGVKYNYYKNQCGNPINNPDHRIYRHIGTACNPPNIGLTNIEIANRTDELMRQRLIDEEEERERLNISSESIAKSLSLKRSSTIKSSENIKINCIKKYSNFRNIFKRLSNKLTRMCDVYNNKCDLNTIKNIKEIIQKKFVNQEIYFDVIKDDIYINILFNTWFKLYLTDIKKSDNMFKVRYDYYLLKIFEKRGKDNILYPLRAVGQGVTRDFFQKIIDELIKYEIFIKPDDSERYFLNPYFDINKIIKIKSYTFSDIKSENTILYTTFYKFLGKLFSFFVLNDFGFNFRLSNCILSHFIYKNDNIKYDDFISFAAFDFPDDFNIKFSNLMRPLDGIEESDLIGSLDMYYNDDIDITDPDDYKVILKDKITDKNFIEYISLYSQEILYNPFKNNKRRLKKLEMDPVDNFYSFIDGFNYIKNHVFKKIYPTIFIIDELLYKNISIDDFNIFKDKFKIKMNKYINHKIVEQELKIKYRTVLISLFMIFDDNGLNFPFNEINISEEEFNINRDKYFLIFIEKLFRFWSGFGYINNELEYNFVLINYNKKTLPNSHMCNTQIDIPMFNNNIPNFDELYKMLVISSFFVEEGTGLLG